MVLVFLKASVACCRDKIHFINRKLLKLVEDLLDGSALGV